ncbi:MAG: YSC84-related protein [Luteolibacter sp.]
MNLLAVGLASLAMLSSCASGPGTRINQATTSASKLEADSRTALNQLYQNHPKARQLASQAKAVLVFPRVSKAGFFAAAQVGNGTLFIEDKPSRFYQTAGISYGFQAGAQQFGYALFAMDDTALKQLDAAAGWEFGGAPSVVILDKGISGTLSTTSMRSGTYVVFFNQKGLMGGMGLQGTKITRIQPGKH